LKSGEIASLPVTGKEQGDGKQVVSASATDKA